MSFEIELGSLGLFRPGLYFILRAQSSLMVPFYHWGCFYIVKGAWCSGQRLKGWCSFIDSLLFHFFLLFSKKGKTMLYPPHESLDLYTFHVLIGSVRHGLIHIYLMCNYASYCEGFCIQWPILPHELAEILRKPKSREEKRLTVSKRSLESWFSIKFTSIQIYLLLNGGIWNAVSETLCMFWLVNSAQSVELSGPADQLSSRGSSCLSAGDQ